MSIEYKSRTVHITQTTMRTVMRKGKLSNKMLLNLIANLRNKMAIKIECVYTIYILVDLVARLLSQLAVPVEMDNPKIHTIQTIHIHFDMMLILVDKAVIKKETRKKSQQNIHKQKFQPAIDGVKQRRKRRTR